MTDNETITTTFSPLEKILEERGKTHGDYSDHAFYTQSIKDVYKDSKNWQDLTACQRETLDMIAHKIGRILAGNPDFADHWVDISGYEKLTADILEVKS